jgi:hypothetical protein
VKPLCQQSEVDEGDFIYGIWQYLLVWKSADTAPKGICLLVIFVKFVKTPGSQFR